jgi:hypothetical protein
MIVGDALNPMVMLLIKTRPCWSLETEVDWRACALLQQHGSDAVYIALDRLNESIDPGTVALGIFWAEVVGVIHKASA